MKRQGRGKWLLIAVVVLQVLFIIGLAASNVLVERLGKQVILETAPVDPRDLFYGDYVILEYEISRLPSQLWMGGGELAEHGDRVYVLLRENGDVADAAGVYQAVGIYPTRPNAASGEAVLPARVDYSWDRNIRLKYGLERYYVPEGTGKRLEDIQDKLLIDIRIAPWGQAKISGIIEPE